MRKYADGYVFCAILLDGERNASHGGKSMSEVEIIRYGHIHGLSLFLNRVEYRTPHLHPEWELMWIMDGTLSVRAGDREYSVKKGSLVLFPPLFVHELSAGTTPAVFLCLQMTPSFLGLAESVTSDSILPGDFLAGDEILKVKRMLLGAALQYFERPLFFQMYCRGECTLLMHDILVRMPVRVLSAEETAVRNRKTERLKRLMDYVEEHYAEKIKLSDFADKEGVSMNYLSHFVKSSLNQSFQSYVNLVRFHAACILISSRKYRMTEVYRLAGFSGYKYFSSTFKARCGLTPEEFSRSGMSSMFNTEAEKRINPRSSERRMSADESIACLRAVKTETGRT